MKNLADQMTAAAAQAFAACGYDASYAKISLSNRPDLCEYQCNGALAAAKAYRENPMNIAEKVAEKLKESPIFGKAEAVRPGFLNLDLSAGALAEALTAISESETLGSERIGEGRTILLDYGGANVAKPLHVGHLRSAIIGESLKRICRFLGFEAIGDVHLGDWGLQMGLIIEALRDEQPELPYFDEAFTGPYPAKAPFTISDLERIYPAASARAKTDEAFSARAHEATFRLQQGHPGYTALFRHIVGVSREDLKKNYDALDVHFDLWKGESDAQPYIGELLAILEEKQLTERSEGALVVPVAKESDTKEVPPCLIQKSDGAYLYATTDLATIIEREKLYHPDEYLYITDKRQAMHFEQVFRVAKKAGIVREETKLGHLGFGTMNGKDGKPFKTRSGGVMRLEYLLRDESAGRRKAGDGRRHRARGVKVRGPEQSGDQGLCVRSGALQLLRRQYRAVHPLYDRPDPLDPAPARGKRDRSGADGDPSGRGCGGKGAAAAADALCGDRAGRV